MPNADLLKLIERSRQLRGETDQLPARHGSSGALLSTGWKLNIGKFILEDLLLPLPSILDIFALSMDFLGLPVT